MPSLLYNIHYGNSDCSVTRFDERRYCDGGVITNCSIQGVIVAITGPKIILKFFSLSTFVAQSSTGGRFMLSISYFSLTVRSKSFGGF